MKKLLLIVVLLAAACREDEAQVVSPVALTADAIDHFCQMNVIEHPGPKAQIHLEGLPGAPLFFAQVRDAVAYARLPEQSHRILAIWVNDMGARGASWDMPGIENWIDAQTAFYVIGSTRMGGMGAPELVPFSDGKAAEDFALQFEGSVVALTEIPDNAVIAPDEPDQTLAIDADYKERLKALSQHQHTGG